MDIREERVARLEEKIARFGKENLEEILHAVAEGVQVISGLERVRIYLEDLTRGALSCAFAAGAYAAELRQSSFPISSPDSMVSGAFVSNMPAAFTASDRHRFPLDHEFSSRFSIGASWLLPLSDSGRAIGVICVDSEEKNDTLESAAKGMLRDFVSSTARTVDRARKYHQQLLLSRRVDEYKKKEAALLMVQSAVRLIDKVSLASVLVHSRRERGELEILASFSTDTERSRKYEELGAIDLAKGQSLLSQYVRHDGVIDNDRLLTPLFIPNLDRHALQKRALTEQMGLRSLYLVPRYEPQTHKLICLVSYFTSVDHRFTDFETGLLQSHAEMVERVVSEVGAEHLEIKVLAEIDDLLQERNEELQPFLNKVLSKATELIGADTGSIGIVVERGGEKFVVVEAEDGTVIGAKNKEWLKKRMTPFRIGGFDLPLEERSLTGYVAWTKEPKILSDVRDEQHGEGFHRPMHELIRSEIAVPFLSEDEVIAVVCLNSLQPAHFTEEHRRILQLIGRLTSRHISDIQRIERLQDEVKRLASDVAYKDPHVSSYRLGNIIGNSRKAQEIVDFINTVSLPLSNRISLWNSNVLQEATIGLPSILVLGQTGAGKEFFFNNLYSKLNGIYRDKINAGGELPVKKTNIAAYSGELTYSELFGHKKGAFTGAYSDRKGILEEAHGGIVFLDEIGDADAKTQVQLLRFLDNGGFLRLGDNVERFSRVLLVAATNRNLQEEIARGNFREDLYHRLSELSVRVPSLNERREDIPDLATHFLGKLYRTYRGKDENEEDAPTLSEEARRVLVGHMYKGNIRELRSILLRALFFRKSGAIGAEDIAQAIRHGSGETPPAAEELNERVATEILNRIGRGGDFWSEVYEPYSGNLISRDAVRLVLDRARQSAGRTMPEIARYLKAVEGEVNGDPETRKKFFRFKNFLYKTVKL